MVIAYIFSIINALHYNETKKEVKFKSEEGAAISEDVKDLLKTYKK